MSGFGTTNLTYSNNLTPFASDQFQYTLQQGAQTEIGTVKYYPDQHSPDRVQPDGDGAG